MLDIAFDLIVEATSNSLLMFCFCNLIIVMILTGSTKPSSKDSQDPTFITPVSFNMCSIASDDRDCGEDDDNEEITVAVVSSAQDESLIDDSGVSDEDENRGSSDEDEDEIDNDNDEYAADDDGGDEEDDDEIKEVEVEEEEEDDELRKRAEEFIAKINNEWRHEKLKALNLVY